MWKTINVVLGKTTRSTSVLFIEQEGRQITDKEKWLLLSMSILLMWASP